MGISDSVLGMLDGSVDLRFLPDDSYAFSGVVFQRF
jgi:hypothetical protein